MAEALSAGIVIAIILLYGWFILVWLTGWIANLIVSPFGKPTDDEVLQWEGTQALGSTTLRPVTRGDQRVRYIAILLVWPALIYLHYRFWQPFWAGVNWFFEHVVAAGLAAIT